jgi:carboxyl-terminal processing protease
MEDPRTSLDSMRRPTSVYCRRTPVRLPGAIEKGGFMPHRFLTVLALFCCIGGALVLGRQSGMSKTDRALYKQMLADIRKDIEKNYYDPKFRGIDLAAAFNDASEKVAATASATDAIDVITNAVFQFGDSHTRFFPPQRATRADYGWTMAAVGGEPLVTAVNPGSDAAQRGLTPGDRVSSLNRHQPTRENLWQILHYYRVVRPQAQQRVVVRKPDGRVVTLDIQSKIERRQVIQAMDAIEEFIDEIVSSFDTDHLVAPDILVWRMTSFRDSDAISPFIGKARKVGALVIDLRDNGGGAVDGLKALVGWLFDHEVPVMTMIGRKGEDRVIAKPRNKPFSGKLIVLVDSRSGSASEVLARLVQIEKRGTVIGDRSAGAVMASVQFGHSFGIGNVTFYSTSVTVSDVRMSDGASLEHVGVTPDEVLLPTPADLAAGRDPVLARAVVLLGGSMTPEQAGKLYPGK